MLSARVPLDHETRARRCRAGRWESDGGDHGVRPAGRSRIRRGRRRGQHRTDGPPRLDGHAARPTGVDRRRTTQGTRNGPDNELGAAVAEDDLGEVMRAPGDVAVHEVDAFLVVAGLGGGTGSGGVSVVGYAAAAISRSIRTTSPLSWCSRDCSTGPGSRISTTWPSRLSGGCVRPRPKRPMTCVIFRGAMTMTMTMTMTEATPNRRSAARDGGDRVVVRERHSLTRYPALVAVTTPPKRGP